MSEDHPVHLTPSELGTKEYWETFYAETLDHLSLKTKRSTVLARGGTNTTSTGCSTGENEESDIEDDDDSDDPGTSWFTEHDAPEKILTFLTSSDFPLAPCNTHAAQENSLESPAIIPGVGSPNTSPPSDQPAILDLGTGNGSMLTLLRKRGGFRGDMVGVDYSEKSIALARELQQQKTHSSYWAETSDSEIHTTLSAQGEKGVGDETAKQIRFEVWDILTSEEDLLNQNREPGKEEKRLLDWFPYDKGGFDIVLDKGTFDAISLSDARDPGSHRRACERYPAIARKLVRRGGFLVVTSCNWTEEELEQWFTGGPDNELTVWARVEYPRFRFGGHEGQGVCTVCFERSL